MLPLFLPRVLCPPPTFKAGSTASVFWLAAGLALVIGSSSILLVRWGTRFPDLGSVQALSLLEVVKRDKFIYLIVTLCGLSASAAIWLNCLESYYCVSIDNILLHPGALAAPRILKWDSVEMVRAECESIKGGYRLGRLVLLIPDESEIDLTFNTQTEASLKHDYEIIRVALAGRKYRYQIASSVTAILCPADLYLLLLRWRQ
jgi:general stress protein CsbA